MELTKSNKLSMLLTGVRKFHLNKTTKHLFSGLKLELISHHNTYSFFHSTNPKDDRRNHFPGLLDGFVKSPKNPANVFSFFFPYRLRHRWDDICAFRVFPCKCQLALQLCELKDDYIQQEIKKPPKEETCNSATGWFSFSTVDCLRRCIDVRFMSVCPHPRAESLLNSMSARFEKAKRNHNFVKVARLEEQEKVNKETENNEVGELAENHEVDEPDDLEDYEDEFEDDNVEEEMDAYESLDLEGDVSLHDDPHTNHDNVSRDYLQELFGNFPSCTTGVDDEQDDQSIGEYQIFDQYNDDSYSEDEDY